MNLFNNLFRGAMPQKGPESGVPEEPASPPSTPESHGVTYLSSEFLVGIAEEVWRLRRRMERLVRATEGESLRSIRDSVTRFDHVLGRHQITIEEHEGQWYDEGLSLNIAYVEGSPGPSEQLWVIETISPTVRLAGRILQSGKVVLGAQKPEGDAE